MNLLTSVLLYSGSGGSSRFGISRLRGICLRAVLRPTLPPPLHANGVERAADDVVADTRKILHTAAADQHQRVLLQVVADAGDVGRHFDAVGEPDARHFAQRRVRPLRRLREHADADAALLRADLQRRALRLRDDLLASLPYELADSRHRSSNGVQPKGCASCSIHSRQLRAHSRHVAASLKTSALKERREGVRARDVWRLQLVTLSVYVAGACRSRNSPGDLHALIYPRTPRTFR